MALSPEKIKALKSSCKAVKKRPVKFFYCLAGPDGEPTLLMGKTIANDVKDLKKKAQKKRFVKGTVVREGKKLLFVTETPTAHKFPKNLKSIFGASIPALKKAEVKALSEAAPADGAQGDPPDVAPPPMMRDILPTPVKALMEFPVGDVDARFVRSLNTPAGRSGLLKGARLAKSRGADVAIADCIITLKNPAPTSLLVDSQIVTLTEWMRNRGVMKSDCEPDPAGGGMAPPPPPPGAAPPPPPSLGEQVKKKVKEMLGYEEYPPGNVDTAFIHSLNTNQQKYRLLSGVNLAIARGMPRSRLGGLIDTLEDKRIGYLLVGPEQYVRLSEVLNEFGVTKDDCR